MILSVRITVKLTTSRLTTHNFTLSPRIMLPTQSHSVLWTAAWLTFWSGCMAVCWNLTHTKQKSLSFHLITTQFVENVSVTVGEWNHPHVLCTVTSDQSYLTTDTTKSIANVRVTSIFIYCYAFLIEVLTANLNMLQNVQNML